MLFDQAREPMQHVSQGSRICRWCSAPPRNQAPRLAARNEFDGVDVCERCEGEPRRADQLGEHTPRAERHQRPEDRVLQRAGKQLSALGDVGLDDYRPADLCCSPSDARPITQVEMNAARFRLVGAGLGGFDDDREAHFGSGVRGRLVASSRSALRPVARRMT